MSKQAKGRNGIVVKIAVAVLTLAVTIGLTSFAWIWNARGYCDDIKANTKDLSETKSNIREFVLPKVDSNTTSIITIQKAVVGFEKDIGHLDEKMESFKSTQQQIQLEQRQFRAEQRQAFNEILKRLPE